MAERTTRIVLPLLAVAALVALLAASPAQAQIDTLPSPDSTSLSQADRDEIASYVEARLTRIGADDPVAREKARRELVSPLSRPSVSVAFRRAFREASIDGLTRLATSDDESISINALLVLGEIADDASRQVVQNYTGDDRIAVRYASVTALHRVFRSIENASPAIDPGRVSELVRHLSGRLKEESDASVADAIVRALLTAAQMRRDGFAPAAQTAAAGLGSTLGPRLQYAEEGGERQITLMSAVRVAEYFATRLQAPGDVPPEVARAGAEFSGWALADLAVRARTSGSMPADGWETDLVTLSERILVFSHQKLGATFSTPGLQGLVEGADSDAFYQAISRVVLGLNSVLPESRLDPIVDALSP